MNERSWYCNDRSETRNWSTKQRNIKIWEKKTLFAFFCSFRLLHDDEKKWKRKKQHYGMNKFLNSTTSQAQASCSDVKKEKRASEWSNLWMVLVSLLGLCERQWREEIFSRKIIFHSQKAVRKSSATVSAVRAYLNVNSCVRGEAVISR